MIDGVTFSRRADLVRVDNTIRRYGFTPVPIYLADCTSRASRTTASRGEVERNQHLARDRSPDLVYEVQARFDTPPPNALVINANQPAADVCRIVIEAVAAIRAPVITSRAEGEG